MPSRSDVQQLQRSQAEVARMARNELAGWWATTSKSDLSALRAEVERFFPLLIDVYGESATAVAADWYEQIYRERPRLAAGRTNAEIARARARWALGSAFQGDMPQALATLGVVTDEMVKQFGRDTIVQSAVANNRTYARVPSGSTTCAFCLTLASRGFAYHSVEDAGGEMNKYHGDCDCQVVPDDGQIPSGYDADAMYEQYQSVHSHGDTINQVATKLRTKYGLK